MPNAIQTAHPGRSPISLSPLVAAALALLVVPASLAQESDSRSGTGLRLYADRQQQTPYDRLLYGFDRNEVCRSGAACVVDADCAPPNDVCGVDVDTLVPGNPTDLWTLVCDPATPGGTDCQVSSWDFSGFNLTAFPDLIETATTNLPVSLDETCSADQCGFNRPGVVMGREDKDFDRLIHVCLSDLTTPCVRPTDCDAGDSCVYAGLCPDDATRCLQDDACSGIGDGRCRVGRVTVNGVEREDRVGDVTVWLRAAIRNDSVIGALGQGESRVCYVDGGGTEVPLLRYDEQDAIGWYQDLGDSWTHAPFDCDPNTYNHTCPDSCSGFCALEANACNANCDGTSQSFSGQQQNTIVNEGVVKLPSGHELNALVLRSVNEFCANPSLFGCPAFLGATPVRTVLYLWFVPHLGTVARLTSNILECDIDATEVMAEADIKWGLFPPLTITSDAVTDDSIEISWNPGLDRRIDRFKVYWDTDSGFDTPYAFDSDTHPGQVVFDGTSATISGLDPGTEYHLTVSAFSTYTNPASGVATTYESLLPPKRIHNSPPAVPSLPIELVETTTSACSPGVEVTGVTVDDDPGGIEICWNVVVDCIDGYRVKGDLAPDAPQSFVGLVDTPVGQTCAVLDPAESYFLVVGQAGVAEGPLGQGRD